ncbi:unnamed protein product [Scytosiphon promiscuus]
MAGEGSGATGSRPATDGSKTGSTWSRFHSRINAVADDFFYRLGFWVANHAKRTLLISLVFVIACCFGFANFRIEADGEDLWVPADSISKKQEAIVLENFAGTNEYAAILMESPSETGSVLTKEAMDVLWELDAIVRAVGSEGETYAELCSKDLDGVTCELPFRGVTRFWDNDVATYEASVTSDADVVAAVNVESFPDGQTVNHLALFGTSIVYDDDGTISGARAMIQAYGLEGDPDDDAQINEDVYNWNEQFQDTMEEAQEDYANVLNVFYLTSRSTDDALEESVSGEIFLFITTCEFVKSYKYVQRASHLADTRSEHAGSLARAVIALGYISCVAVRRRSWLGLGGVMLVVAAGLAAYGLNSAFDIPFTSLSQILPFILIGIGVDDMFVIVAAYDHTDPTLPVEERIALGVKRCGVSVTYTSLTNFFAFLLGSMSSLPAVEYFCLYACTAIFFDFVLQASGQHMTAFVALLTMDANRQKAGKMDWCCCCTNKAYPLLSPTDPPRFSFSLSLAQEGIQRGVALPSAGTGTTGVVQGHDLKAEVHELSAIGKFMKDKYSPVLLSAKGKVFVLVGSALLLAAGIWGVTQSTQGFDVLDLAPDDHYSREYTELAREYEVDISEWYVPLSVYTREVDYTDVTVQAEIQATDERMLEQTAYISGPLGSWLVSFVEWADNSTEYSANVGTSGGFSVYDDPATFYTALSEFTAEEVNARFLTDVIFDDDGTIKISRTDMFLIDQTDTTKNVDALDGTRDVVGESTLEPEQFGFSGVFIFTEQFAVIIEELLTSFGLALVAVLALSLFVLGKVTVVALVCITVFIIDVELLGFVYHWGLDINSITVIAELIMAVGLVVDYMVHLVHYFLHQDPNIPKDNRIADALGEIGPSILVGATTTFLGIMPLAFANNVIFRVFFKMFLCIISFGFFHGVVFIPVVLSMLPDRLVSYLPSATAVTHHDGAAKGGATPAAAAYSSA